MKLIITDNTEHIKKWIPIDNDDIIIINNKCQYCVGCFKCWLYSPGTCVIKDGYEDNGKRISQVDELIIVSRLTFGMYSSHVKNILDRSISYVMPFFEIRNKEMHHQSRYDHSLLFSVYYYGKDMDEDEKKTASSLALANALNLNAKLKEVRFMEDEL